MIKLPKPLATEGVWYPNGTDKPGVVGDCYTEAQMLQFRQDLLEDAAKVANATVCDTHIPTGVKIYGQRAGKAIRALIKDYL
jgi:hypothetical protein